MSEDLFFVGGAPKSGTTWVTLLLDAHPEILCRGEGHFITNLSREISKALTAYNKEITSKNNVVFSEVDQAFPLLTKADATMVLRMAVLCQLAKLSGQPGIRALGEKTPDNVIYMALLWQMFPDAKLINVVRDGRDVALSAWRHGMRLHPKWNLETYKDFSGYVPVMAKAWARNLQAAELAAQAAPDQVLSIRYESLLADPHDVLGQMLAFLGRENTQPLRQRCIEAAQFEKLSGGRAAGVEDRGSFFRKGQAGDWWEAFSARDREVYTEIAGEALARYGYDP
ncbi:MAG: sulfotransferase family protein [Rhodospirillaceae bacterium]